MHEAPGAAKTAVPGLFDFDESVFPVNDREGFANRNGFKSFADLLNASEELPMLPCNRTRSYVTWHPNGYWFVWDDVPEKQADGKADHDPA